MRSIVSGAALVALLCLGSTAPAAEGWYAAAGVAGADLGLDQSRQGLALEVGRILPLPGSRFDFAFRGEYLQKVGNQPRVFVTEENPGFVGDEELVLHYLQPAVSLGYSWPMPSVAPRIYAGASMGLKLGETWNHPADDGLEIFGFEDTDFALHAGASLTWRRWLLDARWEQGLVSQLLVDEGAALTQKAEDPLAGVDDPEDGAKITTWRVLLGFSF